MVGRFVEILDEASATRILLHDGTGNIQFTVYNDQSPDWGLKRGSWA
jgi:hypothetical protein